MYTLIVLEEALIEWQEASIYYELQKVGLGETFSTTIEKNLEIIRFSPKHFQKTKKEYREAFAKPFPFTIVFRLEQTNIFVISIIHTKRKTKKRYKKLKK